MVKPQNDAVRFKCTLEQIFQGCKWKFANVCSDPLVPLHNPVSLEHVLKLGTKHVSDGHILLRQHPLYVLIQPRSVRDINGFGNDTCPQRFPERVATVDEHETFAPSAFVLLLWLRSANSQVYSEATHATGFSQWLMTNFFLSAEFIRR